MASPGLVPTRRRRGDVYARSDPDFVHASHDDAADAAAVRGGARSLPLELWLCIATFAGAHRHDLLLAVHLAVLGPRGDAAARVQLYALWLPARLALSVERVLADALERVFGAFGRCGTARIVFDAVPHGRGSSRGDRQYLASYRAIARFGGAPHRAVHCRCFVWSAQTRRFVAGGRKTSYQGRKCENVVGHGFEHPPRCAACRQLVPEMVPALAEMRDALVAQAPAPHRRRPPAWSIGVQFLASALPQRAGGDYGTSNESWAAWLRELCVDDASVHKTLQELRRCDWANPHPDVHVARFKTRVGASIASTFTPQAAPVLVPWWRERFDNFPERGRAEWRRRLRAAVAAAGDAIGGARVVSVERFDALWARREEARARP